MWRHLTRGHPECSCNRNPNFLINQGVSVVDNVPLVARFVLYETAV